MPQRDIYHDAVKAALSKDGWRITHDPLTVPFGIRKVYLDLGAERLLAAERSGERIAAEIKSFIGVSQVACRSWSSTLWRRSSANG
jgi:hypothetical protein